jgi:hypothetical protein
MIVMHSQCWKIQDHWGKSPQKFSQNIVLTLGTIVFVANVATNGVHVKDKPISVTQDHETTFINLCDFPTRIDRNNSSFFIHPSNFSFLKLIASYVPSIPSTFDEDVLFELPPIDNLHNHFG